MREPTEEEWQVLDEHIVKDRHWKAFLAYREMTGAGINDMKEALWKRELMLKQSQPERFTTDAEYRAEAFRRLRNITERVVVIEGSWDGDSRGFHIYLSAITDQPSGQHPRYSAYPLYMVREIKREVERATEFGTELAHAVGAEFFLTDTNTSMINYEKRWWDDH